MAAIRGEWSEQGQHIPHLLTECFGGVVDSKLVHQEGESIKTKTKARRRKGKRRR